MIKFFRKIRQKLLTENKFSKYLIYAIGEIILVVIGILIALQINNWKSLKDKRNLKNEYITSLKVDLTKDTIQLNERLKRNKVSLKSLVSARDSINNEQIVTTMDFERLFRNLPGGSNTLNTYNTNTFNILVSSGNIDLFDNQEREQIMELNRLQKSEKDASNFNRGILFNVLENTIFKYPTPDNSFKKEVLNKLWKQEKKDGLTKDIISYLSQNEFTINRYIIHTENVLRQTELILEKVEKSK